MPANPIKGTNLYFDPDFRFLLELDPAFESWRKLAAEWWSAQDKEPTHKRSALSIFFVQYLNKIELDKAPESLLRRETALPELLKTPGLASLKHESSRICYHDHISDFIDWVLEKQFAENGAAANRVVPDHLVNPFPRIKKRAGLLQKLAYSGFVFDADFNFLLGIDPDFEPWRKLAAEYWSKLGKKSISTNKYALSAFFGYYLHQNGLDKLPESLFQCGTQLPDLLETLKTEHVNEQTAVTKHDNIVDFLDWVLRTHYSEPDAEGHLVVPDRFANQFQRIKTAITHKFTDLTFSHVTALNPRMEAWRAYSEEWITTQRIGLKNRIDGLDAFLTRYLIGQNLPHNPILFLRRDTPKPTLVDVLVSTKGEGTQRYSKAKVRINNVVSEFLDWVLAEKLSIEDDEGERVVPREFHNPVPRLSQSGIDQPTESVRTPLSMRYIRQLRTMLCEGPSFRDWVWAQKVYASASGADWFIVDPALVDPNDPDCVWQERQATMTELKNGLPETVTEIWSPVRAVALYIKLELPLRTIQVRFLDSGEADTWRYVHGPNGGGFVMNDSPLATGNEKRPYQRGVFHRSQHEASSGLYINTNKTADFNKPENAKGYVIPWTHEAVLYWLEKLRNWQARYNPIEAPTAWTKLEKRHFGNIPPHADFLATRGTACFLFRDAAAEGIYRLLPITNGQIDTLWHRLLGRLEESCQDQLDDGTPIRFVDPSTKYKTHFPLHALRVSIISYLVLDAGLDLAVVSKLIAGHARLIMTIYYTKFGKTYMSEVLAKAERRELEALEQNHRRFLMDATYEQVGQRFSAVSDDAYRAAIGQPSAAGLVFEDKGVCPVGGAMCDVGGEERGDRETTKYYGPVPGYPQERNCVRCRFFLSGPAFLPGLQAHINTLFEKANRQSDRYNRLEEQINEIEDRRFDCESANRPFTETKELERLSQRHDAEAETLGKLVNDIQATGYIIARSLDIANKKENEGVQLVAVGDMSDLQWGIEETESELHQFEVVCENAVIYPETDAGYATIRRSQILDGMLRYNGMEPVFMGLTPDQQLLAGNAVMELIKARTGSLKGALPFAECREKLKDLRLIDETWDAIAGVVSGTPARDLIDAAHKGRKLGVQHAS